MIVQCEQCLTRFKLDTSLIKGGQAKVRCSQCGFVFVVHKQEQDQKKDIAARTAREGLLSEQDFAEDDDLLMHRKRPRTRAAGSGHGWAWAVIVVAVLVALAAGYYFYGKDLKSELLSVLQRQKQAPLSEPAAEDQSYKKIILSAAEGYFKTSKALGALFVIKGVAQNKNLSPVSFIKLKGILHDTNGQQAMDREVYAGNLFTDEELESFSLDKIKERSANNRGANDSNFNVPSEGTVNYMIIFNGIPDNLAEFTVKVVESHLSQEKPK